MAAIRSSRQKQGVSKNAAKFLLKDTRSKTNKAYNKGWRRWSDWCQHNQPSLNPEEYQVQYVLEFLMDNNQYSYQTLNGLRSAITSVFKVLHPYQPTLADQQLIANFFKAKRRTETRIPSVSQLKTWDLTLINNFIRKTMSESQNLTLTTLQQKTILLVGMATMGRPRSDLGRMQYQDIQFKYQKSSVVGVTIHFREPKESQVKTTQLGILADKSICPTSTLLLFKEKSEHLRNTQLR
ncbi:hypothetical protein G6F56_011983 [Rhizopus delemar]|nr:hypothetical protein G6F56_011983 [Rhizopus delemar]